MLLLSFEYFEYIIPCCPSLQVFSRLPLIVLQWYLTSCFSLAIFFYYLFILLLLLLFFFFLAMLGLHCYACFSLVTVRWGYSLVAMCKLLVVLASLVAKHRLWRMWASVAVVIGLSSCRSWALKHRLGAQAQLLHGMWGFPGSRIEPMSPALTGVFFFLTTE